MGHPLACLHELLRVVTHPRVYHPPLPVGHARAYLGAITASPALVLLSETDRHLEILNKVLAASRVTGNLVHEAHIAALCLEHGVREILTADRDFLRFPGLRAIDPFS